MKSIKQRAAETLQKRIRGSFGYRAADSVLTGFSPEENLVIYKAHGGTKEGLENSLKLAIDRAKPIATAEELARDADMDPGEAAEALKDEFLLYDDMVKNQRQYLIQLENAFIKAPEKYESLGEASAENFRRIIERLNHSARTQYIRSRNSDWMNAVKEASTPVLEAVVKLSETTEKPSDKEAA